MTETELLQKLLNNGEEGRFTNFKFMSQHEQSIPASVIREFLATQACPLLIEGATIEGELDLHDAYRAGNSAFPALSLHGCDLSGAIVLRGVRIAALSLQQSRFHQLDISQADIAGDLDCSNANQLDIQNPPEQKPIAILLGRGARIGGSVLLNGSRFQSHPRRVEPPPSPEEPLNWAVHLGGSRIEGSVELRHCTASGGIHLGGSRIGGDLWCYGTTCSANEDVGFRLQRARISGALVFDHGTRIDGGLDMMGAEAGFLELRKITLTPNADRICLSANSIRVANYLQLGPGLISSKGQTLFDGAHIGGDLLCHSCRFEGVARADVKGAPWASISFSAHGAQVMGDLMIGENPEDQQSSFCDGSFWLGSVKVTGNVRFGACYIQCFSKDNPPVALSLQGARIGGGLDFSSGFSCRGSIVLAAAVVEGDLAFDQTQITTLVTKTANQEAPDLPAAVNARGIKVGGSVSFTGNGIPIGLAAKAANRRRPSSCRVLGQLLFDSAEIGSDFLCTGVDLERAGRFQVPYSVSLGIAQISGSLTILNCTVRAGIQLYAAQIRGALTIDGSDVLNSFGTARHLALNLVSARVGVTVALFRCTFEGLICLDECKISGPVHITGCDLFEGIVQKPDGERVTRAFKAESAEFEGNLSFETYGRSSHGSREDPTYPTTIRGMVDLSHSVVRGMVLFSGCTLQEGTAFALVLQAEGITIEGSLEFINVQATGSFEVKHAKVGANLRWDGLRFFGKQSIAGQPENTNAIPKPRDLLLALDHAQIGGALEAMELSSEHASLTVDLSHGSTTTLEEDPERGGWGAKGGEARVVMDGFSYENISPTHDVHIMERPYQIPLKSIIAGLPHKWFDDRLNRLTNHHRAKDYHPQPYLRFSTILKNQGYDTLSREAAVRGRWEEWKEEVASAHIIRRLYLRAFSAPFGVLFGFGLDPVRALITLITLLTIGTVGVASAAYLGVLTATSPPSQFRFDVQKNAFISSPIISPCEALHWESKSWPKALAADSFYTLNLAVPFVQLHQKAECEIASASVQPDRMHSATLWHGLENLYSVLAKLVTSLALITFSGVVRRCE